MKCSGRSCGYWHCGASLIAISLLFASFEPSCKSGKTEPVTAVAFAHKALPTNKDGIDYNVLAIGTESGHIEVWTVPLSSNDEQSAVPYLMYALPGNDCHFYTVNKLAWRPSASGVVGDAIEDKAMTLASCSEDCGVRIFSLLINQWQ
jgi:WD40 repeat protein